MATVEFDPQPLQAYTNLEKAGAEKLLDAIDDAIDALETDPGNAVVRRRWKRGAKGTRTPGLLHAMQALYQLSYSPWTPAKRQQRLASVLDRHWSAVIAEHGLGQRARVVLQQPPPAAAPG